MGIGLVGFASAQLTQRFLKASQVDSWVILAKLEGLEAQLAELRHEVKG